MVIHSVIRHVLRPLEESMKNGIRLKCADGVERLCYPVLCEYIADMEEQWLLTCLKRTACPKCHIHIPNANERLETRAKNDEIFCQTAPEFGIAGRSSPRSDDTAFKIRLAFENDELDSDVLDVMGYHPELPFSYDYPIGGILNSVGPDLLHQISKCFHDYIIEKFIYPLIEKYHGNNANMADLRKEFDSRFALMPGYPNLRRFVNGILTENHHWTVHEYKAMMKVIVGVLAGICPPEGIQLVKEYLHIHRLSHYHVHTEKSLEWLNSAIQTFWKILKNPQGLFMKYGLMNDDFMIQRLHYLFHYATSIREKEALPSYSTDRTEIYHKPLKGAYRRSNKGQNAIRTILREQARITAFQTMTGGVQFNDIDDDDADDSRRDIDDISDDIGNTDDDPGGTDDIGGGTSDADGAIGGEAVKSNSKLEPSATWPKKHRRGWPKRISATERALQLDGLQAAYGRFITKKNSESNFSNFIPIAHEPDPMMKAYNGVVLRYPSWITDEMTVRVEREAYMGEEEILPSQDAMIKERIRAGAKGYSRRDCVLIRSPGEGRGKPDTMTGRKVGQVLLFFTVRNVKNANERLELAFVSLFETKRRGNTGVDPTTGMFHMHRTSRLSVIEVKDIERGVHLIPKFGREIGGIIIMRRIIEEKRMIMTFEEMDLDEMTEDNDPDDSPDGNVSDVKVVVSINTWLDVLPYYEDFWLNIWTDNHIYKIIY